MNHLHPFDVAERLHTRCLVGPKRGEEARNAFQEAVTSGGPDAVWNVSFANSLGIEYGFASSFLGPILDNCGRSIAHSNVVVVVSGRCDTDRGQLLKGLAWQEGDKAFPPEDQLLTLLASKQRCFVFCASAAENPLGPLEYMGTVEKELHDLLAFLETVPQATITDVEERLDWKTEIAVHRLEELAKRRQVFVLPETGKRNRYASVLRILGKGDAT